MRRVDIPIVRTPDNAVKTDQGQRYSRDFTHNQQIWAFCKALLDRFRLLSRVVKSSR